MLPAAPRFCHQEWVPTRFPPALPGAWVWARPLKGARVWGNRVQLLWFILKVGLGQEGTLYSCTRAESGCTAVGRTCASSWEVRAEIRSSGALQEAEGLHPSADDACCQETQIYGR